MLEIENRNEKNMSW